MLKVIALILLVYARTAAVHEATAAVSGFFSTSSFAAASFA